QGDDAEYMIPTVWEHSTWHGEILALPHRRPPPFIAYNKRPFRESGLDPERPPTSWAEPLAVPRPLTATTEGTPLRRGYQLPPRAACLPASSPTTIACSGNPVWIPSVLPPAGKS